MRRRTSRTLGGDQRVIDSAIIVFVHSRVFVSVVAVIVAVAEIVIRRQTDTS